MVVSLDWFVLPQFGSASATLREFARTRESSILQSMTPDGAGGCIGGNERYTVTLTIKSAVSRDFIRYIDRYTTVTERYRRLIVVRVAPPVV